MKKLILINGVTGAVGSAMLAEFGTKKDCTVIGLTRKALHFNEFRREKFYGIKTMLCSIDLSNKNELKTFINSLPLKKYSSVTYIHALGLYPFEITKEGKFSVSDDNDKDGINDETLFLSHTVLLNFATLLAKTSSQVKIVSFGGLADAYKPEVHSSWWRVRALTEEKINSLVEKYNNLYFLTLNISSVLCTHELLTRPFVFLRTDAVPFFWLQPQEIARKITLLVKKQEQKILQHSLYHKAPYFNETYMFDKNFTKRKMKELGYSE